VKLKRDQMIKADCRNKLDAYYGYVDGSFVYLGNVVDVELSQSVVYACCSKHLDVHETESDMTTGGCIDCLRFIQRIPKVRNTIKSSTIPEGACMQTAPGCNSGAKFVYAEVKLDEIKFTLLQDKHKPVQNLTYGVCDEPCIKCCNFLYLAQNVWK
jgi:hypothetical protein